MLVVFQRCLPFFLPCLKKKVTNIATESSDFTEKLKTLNELYKSGALTKSEFTKAKKKLLN